MNESMYEEIKSQVIAQGDEAINDLLGYEHKNEPENILRDMMDDVLDQMPEEEALKFYHKYCMQPVIPSNSKSRDTNTLVCLLYFFYDFVAALPPDTDRL